MAGRRRETKTAMPVFGWGGGNRAEHRAWAWTRNVADAARWAPTARTTVTAEPTNKLQTQRRPSR